jgi:hypothetical protein
VATLAVAEFCLGQFVSPRDAVLPDILKDSVSGTIITVRQIEEGVATTHFSAGGARLTGNAWLGAAPTVVIIGDSYVAAREVPDEMTMGAWLERRARGSGVPLDVRQYGWRGASPARYVASAPDVLARWNPAAVVVPLSDDDLDERAVSGTTPYLDVRSDGGATVIGGGASAAVEQARPSRFIVAKLVERRWNAIWARAPRALHRWLTPTPAIAATTAKATTRAPADLARVRDDSAIPSAVVGVLKRSYGARLVIAYLADVRVTGGDTADASEFRLLEACRTEGVSCVSLRSAMLRARNAGVIVRGFSTTTLGVGHLNADGHRLVADAVWPMVRPLVRQRPTLATSR